MSSTKPPEPRSNRKPALNYLNEFARTISQPLVPVLELIIGKGKIKDDDRPIIAIAIILTIILGIVVVAPPDNPYVGWVLFIFFALVTPYTWGKFLRDVWDRGSDKNATQATDQPPATVQPQEGTSNVNMTISARGAGSRVESSPQTVHRSSADATDVDMKMDAENGGTVSETPMTYDSTIQDTESDTESDAI